MSFNYTPPPLEVIRTGQLTTSILYAVLLFVPQVKRGALIGGLGSAAITCWVTSHASGDMGSLSVLIETPLWGVIGALLGAVASFAGQTALRLFRKSRSPGTASATQEEKGRTEANTR